MKSGQAAAYPLGRWTDAGASAERAVSTEPPRVVRNLRYGASVDHEADLYLPARSRPPVVCLLHGGFWRMPYGRDQLSAVAEDLSSHGLAVWNLEYARLGGSGGWPRTGEDVSAGIDHLLRLSHDAVDLDLERVVVVGHSAGGHLALCEAARRHHRDNRAERVRIQAVVGLAPIADLALAHDSRVGGTAVAELIGGDPREHPELCGAASPAEMLPLGVRQLIVHGTADDAVPIDLSTRYVEEAAAAGDSIELVPLLGTGHMDYLDPISKAHVTVRQWLLTCLLES